jgi:hypothetical protein
VGEEDEEEPTTTTNSCKEILGFKETKGKGSM